MQLSTGMEPLGLAVLFLGAGLGFSMAWLGVQDPMATESSGKGATQEPKVKLAVEVEVEEGNIFAVDGLEKRIQLTSYGLDRDPSLSPDGRRVVFIRETPGRLIDLGPVDGESVLVSAGEIWVAEVDGSGSRCIAEGREQGESPRGASEPYYGFETPLFKSCSEKIVFRCICWATSSAVYEIDLRDLSTRYLTHGNALEVILTGKYKDHLLIQQHRNRQEGSYDWYWLVASDGRVLDSVGPDPHGFRQLNMGAE